jgi:integrase/recombinase XerD
MGGDLVTTKSGALETRDGAPGMPPLIARAGGHAEKRFIEFFAAQIRNRNTREAYLRAVRDFLGWAEDEAGLQDLLDIEPVHVAAWVELKTKSYEAQSVKAAARGAAASLRLVTGQVLSTNPASFVRGPKFSYAKGKTPILTPNEARRLIRAIRTDTLVGLRDRALIGLMIYTFARVSAAVAMNVKDVYQKQETLWVRLHEKGGKHHEMPCQHNLKDWLREYIEVSGIGEDKERPPLPHRGPQEQSARLNPSGPSARLGDGQAPGAAGRDRHPLYLQSHLPGHGDHRLPRKTPRPKLEHAQQMAAHSDPETTRLYDRRSDKVSLDEVERIGI